MFPPALPRYVKYRLRRCGGGGQPTRFSIIPRLFLSLPLSLARLPLLGHAPHRHLPPQTPQERATLHTPSLTDPPQI